MKGGIGAEELEQDQVNLGSVVGDQDLGSDRCNLTQQEYTPHDMNHMLRSRERSCGTAPAPPPIR